MIRARWEAGSLPAVTLPGDDQHRDPLHEGMRKVPYGGMEEQQGCLAMELRREISPSTVREPCPLRALRRHPISARLEEVQCEA